MTSPDSDEELVEHIRSQPISNRIDALLDAVNDTAAEWQPAHNTNTEGRAR